MLKATVNTHDYMSGINSTCLDTDQSIETKGPPMDVYYVNVIYNSRKWGKTSEITKTAT